MTRDYDSLAPIQVEMLAAAQQVYDERQAGIDHSAADIQRAAVLRRAYEMEQAAAEAARR